MNIKSNMISSCTGGDENNFPAVLQHLLSKPRSKNFNQFLNASHHEYKNNIYKIHADEFLLANNEEFFFFLNQYYLIFTPDRF